MLKRIVKRILSNNTTMRRILRKRFALSYYLPKIAQIKKWVYQSNETANFTYDLADENILYLAHTISCITHEKVNTILSYIEEIRNDDEIKNYVSEMVEKSDFKTISDKTCFFGRRIGWYAFARIVKPKVIVETGVDKGHGSIVLCAALERNAHEQHPGYYFGTDINPEAGFLFGGRYKKFGEILYGDSIESLKTLDRRIDIFINDSDHSAEYEYREYLSIEDKLSEKSIILGDNSHSSNALARFSLETGRKFLFFHEVPKDHWYPGAGIGISFL